MIKHNKYISNANLFCNEIGFLKKSGPQYNSLKFSVAEINCEQLFEVGCGLNHLNKKSHNLTRVLGKHQIKHFTWNFATIKWQTLGEKGSKILKTSISCLKYRQNLGFFGIQMLTGYQIFESFNYMKI